MISSTAKTLIATLVGVGLLSGCASVGSEIGCSGTQTPPPQWLNKTAFELNLSRNFYYGKGAGNTQKQALAEAYGDIAQRVSVNIFSRSIVQQTNAGTRAEAVSKAISDVAARGIEPFYEWLDVEACQYHMMLRVPKALAAQWKTAAQSYLVTRPGLGRVRRAAVEIHAIRYGELGKPKLFLQWSNPKADFLSQRAVIESIFRRTLRRSQIEFSNSIIEAKNILRLAILADRQNIVIEASLLSKNNRLITKIAQQVASDEALESSVSKIARTILKDWLGENSSAPSR